MTTLHVLTVRANAAMSRLAALQQRAERAPGAAPVLRAALRELASALEDLRIAADHLKRHADDLQEARVRASAVAAKFEEFVDAVPLPCVWTDEQGQIDDANPAAADLLNVSETHLVGRPLMLFIADRQKFADVQVALTDQQVIEIPLVLRPRERRARPIRLVGRRTSDGNRRIWFLIPATSSN